MKNHHYPLIRIFLVFNHDHLPAGIRTNVGHMPWKVIGPLVKTNVPSWALGPVQLLCILNPEPFTVARHIVQRDRCHLEAPFPD